MPASKRTISAVSARTGLPNEDVRAFLATLGEDAPTHQSEIVAAIEAAKAVDAIDRAARDIGRERTEREHAHVEGSLPQTYANDGPWPRPCPKREHTLTSRDDVYVVPSSGNHQCRECRREIRRDYRRTKGTSPREIRRAKSETRRALTAMAAAIDPTPVQGVFAAMGAALA